MQRNVLLSCVVAALAMSAAPLTGYTGPDPRQPRDTPRDAISRPSRYRSRPCKGRGGKRAGWGKYKGSPSAKKASRRGGNPARW